jgi:spore germination protein YaaH
VRHIDQVTVVAPGAYAIDSLEIIWGSVSRRVLELARRDGAELQWDAEQGVTFPYNPTGGSFGWLLLDDVQSFRAKLALAKEKRLRGFSAWVSEPEEERIWDVLRAERAVGR